VKRVIAVFLFCLVTTATALAQMPAPFDFYEPGPFAAGVPTPDEALGYPIGTRHSYYHQMENYIHALERTSSRVRILEYGQSYEGRTLYLVLISSESNLSRLEAVREATATLADPRRVADQAALEQLLADTPATVWLNYANDGNESAAFETGMLMAYRLAAGEDETTRRIREQVLTIINPAHNPESHERFVAWYNAIVQGTEGNPDPNAAEHKGDWLMNSNDNHYHIDPNRDAIVLSQRETRAVIAQFHNWNPQVFIDHHGNPPIFYFPPVARPVNENLPESYQRWETLLGRAIAGAFDRRGWSYMSREVYDLHYVGYFDSYPSLNGAIGMTFETDGGGSQGLRLERPDKTHSSLAGAIAKHFTGGLATLTAVSERSADLLRDFYLFRQTGMEEGERDPVAQFVLLLGNNPWRAAELVALLQRHNIEVYRASAPFASTSVHNYFDDQLVRKEFPSGTYVIPTHQPQKRLLTALLEREAKLNDDFLAAVEVRRERNDSLGKKAKKERIGFYDVTAWSLPLSFGVEAYWTEDRAGGLELVEQPSVPAGGVIGGRARYAYLFKPEANATLELTAQLFREEYKMVVSRTELKAAGETFPPGTVLLRVERNAESLHERIHILAQETGVRVWSVDAAWTESGPSLASRQVEDLEAPRVAIAAYEPTNGRAFGHLWFLFEQIIDYPFTPIRVDHLDAVDLGEYDVLIFPHGKDEAYEKHLGKKGIERLKAWIEGGGVFVGLKGGAAFATRSHVGWTSSRLHGRPPPGEAKEGDAAMEKDVPETPGAILRVQLNPAHFLSFGSAPEQVVLMNSALIFTPSTEGTNVGLYAEENTRVSGFIWPDSLERLAGSAYLIDENVGRGHVILFADDPAFRLMWPRLTRLLLNSVFLAPSLR
jgi:hypothetical protein